MTAKAYAVVNGGLVFKVHVIVSRLVANSLPLITQSPSLHTADKTLETGTVPGVQVIPSELTLMEYVP